MPRKLSEVLANPESTQLIEGIVSALRDRSGRGMQLIFMNCEMHETPGGMTVSDHTFTLSKPILGSPKTTTIDLDAPLLSLLNRLGRQLMVEVKDDRVTLDVVIPRQGAWEAFVDQKQPRLEGGDDFFKTKHKVYIETYPLLASIP